ncbi:MAG: hypothetical protein H0W73_17345 [Bacteroidetes bacterium]|nr:hypothetical protein [Bacteroidota bacterium]
MLTNRIGNCIFIIALTWIPFLCFSQIKYTKKAFIKDSIEIMKPPIVRPQLRIDNRTIFFKGQALNVHGFDAGVLLKEKLRLTLGYYALNSNLEAYKKTENGIDYERNIKLRYGGINTEFIYKNTRYFSLGMPIDFGFGKNTLQYTRIVDGEIYETKSGFIFSTEFGLSAIFKPIRWIGIKGILGYRKTLLEKADEFYLDGVFTSVGLYLDIREIIRDVRMFKIKKKYRKKSNSIGTAVDLITD